MLKFFRKRVIYQCSSNYNSEIIINLFYVTVSLFCYNKQEFNWIIFEYFMQCHKCIFSIFIWWISPIIWILNLDARQKIYNSHLWRLPVSYESTIYHCQNLKLDAEEKFFPTTVHKKLLVWNRKVLVIIHCRKNIPTARRSWAR